MCSIEMCVWLFDVCLFVFWFFFCLFGVYAANFDLCSALMAIEQCGFFNMPHLLRHGVSIYNSHLREPVTLTSIAERLAVELSLPVVTT